MGVCFRGAEKVSQTTGFGSTLPQNSRPASPSCNVDVVTARPASQRPFRSTISPYQTRCETIADRADRGTQRRCAVDGLVKLSNALPEIQGVKFRGAGLRVRAVVNGPSCSSRVNSTINGTTRISAWRGADARRSTTPLRSRISTRSTTGLTLSSCRIDTSRKEASGVDVDTTTQPASLYRPSSVAKLMTSRL